jgi:hypothetical protein
VLKDAVRSMKPTPSGGVDPGGGDIEHPGREAVGEAQADARAAAERDAARRRQASSPQDFAASRDRKQG